MQPTDLDTWSSNWLYFFFLEVVNSFRESAVPRESRSLGKVLVGILSWIFPTSHSLLVVHHEVGPVLCHVHWNYDILLSTWAKYPGTELYEATGQENNFAL